jgi:hypothetical protein
VTRNKKNQPVDTAWPPSGVRDLKPDVPVNDRADHVRFPTLREALVRKTAEKAAPRASSTSQVSSDMLTEPLVQDLLRRTRNRTVEYLCRAYLQFGSEVMSSKDLESLCAAGRCLRTVTVELVSGQLVQLRGARCCSAKI